MLEKKLAKLDNILNDLGSFAIAFSGGVDSSFLLHRANKVSKNRILAITIRTPYIPSREIAEAVEFTEKYGIRHQILDLDFPVIIKSNPINRCYLCKKMLFTELVSFASADGFKYIADGTNADDAGDYRPGMKALEEMQIRSPLLEAGLTKNDIRELLKNEGLSIWDKPAMACLLTRIPYDTEIELSTLKMIEEAENFISDSGFPGTILSLVLRKNGVRASLDHA